MDAYLLSIIDAAEAGQPTPNLEVITTGGDWIKGQPCSSDAFRNVTWSHYLREITTALEKRPRYERKNNPVDPNEVAASAFTAFVEKEGSVGEPALSLTQAFLSFGGRSDGMKLPAVRVPLKAISSWWVAGGSYVKPGQSGGLFGGVMFPIPIGN